MRPFAHKWIFGTRKARSARQSLAFLVPKMTRSIKDLIFTALTVLFCFYTETNPLPRNSDYLRRDR